MDNCFALTHSGSAGPGSFKRIYAARTARRFPAIFDAVADGRLHLSGVVMLAPHLTEANAAELLAAAAHKTKAEIELLLAHRFPRRDVATSLAPEPHVHARPDSQHAPEPRNLLPTLPHHRRRPPSSARSTPCSRISSASASLERDHVTPVALGGQPTTDGIRTMCKRHNAYEAERILGAEVVAAGRRRRARTKAPTPAATSTREPQASPPAVVATALDADTFRALRTMRVTADDARDAIARSAQVRVDTLEQRIRAALIALQATYASRCGEPALGWGWHLVATSAGHVGGRANGGHDSTAPRSPAA